MDVYVIFEWWNFLYSEYIFGKVKILFLSEFNKCWYYFCVEFNVYIFDKKLVVGFLFFVLVMDLGMVKV